MTSEHRHTARHRSTAVGLALIVLVSACGGSGGSESTGSARSVPESGLWEFTDDRGKTVTLPSRPLRIVAQVHAAAGLWDLGVRPVGVFGPQKRPDGSNDTQVGNVDLAAVQSVGSSFGEFNLEKFAALKLDLVVTIMDGPVLWYVPEEAQTKIGQVAPIVGIQLAGTSLVDGIKRFSDLASSLGANLDAPEVRSARRGFEAAAEKVRQEAKAKPGLKVAVAIGDDEAFWVASPAFHGDVKYFGDLGLDIVRPTNPDPAFGFEKLSWEQADRYPADLILEDARQVGLTPEELTKKQPTWRLLPAVQAQQVAPWQAETPYTYQQYTRILEKLAESVRTSRTDVVT